MSECSLCIEPTAALSPCGSLIPALIPRSCPLLFALQQWEAQAFPCRVLLTFSAHLEITESLRMEVICSAFFRQGQSPFSLLAASPLPLPLVLPGDPASSRQGPVTLPSKSQLSWIFLFPEPDSLSRYNYDE